MILIFHSPGTTRMIPGVVEIMGFDFFDEKFIPGRPFGWFRKGSDFGFGLMPEFWEKRFTHIGLIGHPQFPVKAMKQIAGCGNLVWLKCPPECKGSK